MKILAFETSCDETGVALIEAAGRLSARGLRADAGAMPRFRIVHDLVASQIKIHRPFGGVVPNLAKREHLKNLPILFKKLRAQLRAEGKTLKPDLITVTAGPGLEPALWTGIVFAKEVAKQFKVPLVGANHLEGHLYSFLLPDGAARTTNSHASRTAKSAPPLRAQNVFPAIALIVSGGHTILLKVDSLVKWRRLGETRDDAAGEAFDKVARILDLPYPGGPEVEKLARAWAQKNPKLPGGTIAFPRPMLHPAPSDRNAQYDFSFSGLKTSVLYYVRDHREVLTKSARGDAARTDVAASFQTAALDVLTAKTLRAARAFGARSIILCGGVAANKALRARLAREAKKAGCQFLVPAFKYNMDNAAMIAVAGYFARLRKKRYPLRANGGMEI